MQGGEKMKRILLLSTGGTIAARPGDNGFEPQLRGDSLLAQLGGDLTGQLHFEVKDIFQIDSTNMQPEHWQVIAKEVFDGIKSYDGVIITHGTDTMAYTASAVSFMLQNLDGSVVFTGSQLPIENPLTDARTNLYTAIAAVENQLKGVTVAFNRKIIRGTRAVKVSTMGFDAFDSVNAGYVGQIFADGLRIFTEFQTGMPTPDPARSVKLVNEISPDVFLLKLLPGTKPELFDVLPSLGYRGVVVEAFGAGGVHYLHRDILNKLRQLTGQGIAVVVCSQCLYERSDMTIYEVGQRLLDCGVISGRDMTTEATTTKLMWALGQTQSLEDITRIFSTNYAGEFTEDL